MTPDGGPATTPNAGRDSSNTAPEQPSRQGGVLATLPRTRPQRPSARRAAARRKAESEASATARATADAETTGSAEARGKHSREKDSRKKEPTRARASHRQNEQSAAEPATAPRARARAKAKAKSGAKPKRRLTTVKPPEPAVPKQGYEPEEEVELGKSVSPPSGLELVESLAAVLGELAGGSLSAGGRLLKDALSGLRRP